MMTSRKSLAKGLGVLLIDNIFVKVNLGVSYQERIKPQKVALSIKISFKKIPSIAYTDNIKDGICYVAVIKEVQRFCASKTFSVIEHLAFGILTRLKEFISAEKIQVKVQKWPKIEGVKASVMFECETN